MSEKGRTENSMAPYEVIISIKKDKYFCRIPELYLVAKGNDLGSSYQELMKKKGALFKEIEEFENEDECNPPLVTRFGDSKGSRSSSTENDLRNFLIKKGVVGLLILILFIIASQIISGEANKLVNNVTTGIKNSTRFSPGQITNQVNKILTGIKNSSLSNPVRIEKALNHAADLPIDPEREHKIAANIRVIVNRLKPFAREFRPLLEEVGLAKNKD